MKAFVPLLLILAAFAFTRMRRKKSDRPRPLRTPWITDKGEARRASLEEGIYPTYDERASWRNTRRHYD